MLQVVDQYLHFISLEEDMFTLRPQNADAASYYGKLSIQSDCITLVPIDLCVQDVYPSTTIQVFRLSLLLPVSEINRADVKDTEMEQTISIIVEGLFSYFVTVGECFKQYSVSSSSTLLLLVVLSYSKQRNLVTLVMESENIFIL